MPVYEYECLNCGRIHEEVQKFSDKPLTICPHCKGKLKKIISNTSFVLKGTGWYKTDYASPSKKGAADPAKKPETKDARPDAKSDSKAWAAKP